MAPASSQGIVWNSYAPLLNSRAKNPQISVNRLMKMPNGPRTHAGSRSRAPPTARLPAIRSDHSAAPHCASPNEIVLAYDSEAHDAQVHQHHVELVQGGQAGACCEEDYSDRSCHLSPLILLSVFRGLPVSRVAIEPSGTPSDRDRPVNRERTSLLKVQRVFRDPGLMLTGTSSLDDHPARLVLRPL